MKFNRKIIRVAEWFDADDHSTVYVVEVKRRGKWVGVMLDGKPQAYPDKAEAEKILELMVGMDVPDKNIKRRRTCVAQMDGGKGIVRQEDKHIALN